MTGYPYKKGKSGHRDRSTGRTDDVKTQGEHHEETEDWSEVPRSTKVCC